MFVKRHFPNLLGKAVFLILTSTSIAGYAQSNAANPTNSLPKIEDFFQAPSMSGVEISPNGRYVAARIGGKNNRAELIVLDIETLKPTVVAAYQNDDIGLFRWINNDRLIYTTTDILHIFNEMGRSYGLYAVNRDESKYKSLGRQYGFYEVNHDYKTNDVFVYRPEAIGYNHLFNLNTSSGHAEELDIPLHSNDWIFDRNDQLNVVMTHFKDKASIQYFDGATKQWKVVKEFNYFKDDALHPLYLDANGFLYVTDYGKGDKRSIYKWDIKNNKISDKAIITSPDFDIAPTFIESKKGLLGVRFKVDAEVTYWFDEKMKAVQAEIDQRLPTTINSIGTPWDPELPYITITAFSDQQPAIFLLYNLETKKITKLGAAYPAIKSNQMATVEFNKIKARDGIDIPVYVTTPAGKDRKNLPAIVLVHGGPWVRGGSLEWNPTSQFLASRGYLVIEPEFRGSQGYGKALSIAGRKQWGLAMQDDVTDATQWAVNQGYADANRICIAGASYGGYATLMGLAKAPNLYKCGIEWIGVTDINLIFDKNWGDISDDGKNFGLPLWVGDLVQDAQQLKDTSPVNVTEKITQPLLMAYGEDDRRVPLEHGKRFYKKVKEHNPKVEFITYEHEGHGFRALETNVDFWGRVEKFLEKNIGK